MGRKKVNINEVYDDKAKRVPFSLPYFLPVKVFFNKRKNGLLKKASELSALCDISMMVVFCDLDGNLVRFFSRD